MRHPFLKDMLLGGVGYPLLEICYRGRTHWTMALTGGLAVALLRRVRIRQKKRALWQQALWGGLLITGLEYVVGRGFNQNHRIWDYRRMPLNLHGQICLAYSACWCALSAAMLALMRKGRV